MKTLNFTEQEIKSKETFRMGYKSKDAWFDDSPQGKPFIKDCMDAGCPVELKAQGKLESGVEFIEVKIYFKSKNNQS